MRIEQPTHPFYALDRTDTVHLDLTVQELQNLQRFHATRQSRNDDGCVEAHIGYDVEKKLIEALERVDLDPVGSDDLATY